MRQSLKNVTRSMLCAALIIAGACSSTPAEPVHDLESDAPRPNRAEAPSMTDPAADGVFIGGGMAAPVDSSGAGRGVFIGGGM